MLSSQSPWRIRLVRAGKTRARVAIISFSVITSVVLVTLLMIAVDAPAEDWALYLLPAVLVPLVVSPLASHLVLELAFELESANAHAVQQEAELRALVEHAPIGIARLDRHGRVCSANPRASALLGEWNAQAPHPWRDLFVSDADHAAFRDALAHARPLDALRWQWRRNGAPDRTVRVALVPMPAGTTPHDGPDSVLLAEDITQREAVEAQLLRAQKLDLVGQLAGGLAHDFNNLLTVVRANASVLGARGASPEVTAIEDAAARGARITRRLLAIGRDDLIAPVAQPVAPVLHDTVELIRRALPSRITVVPPVTAPDVTLLLDADAVQQALLNLAVNARDAIAGDGTLRIETTVSAHGEGRMLVISVTDDGEGMSDDVLARAVDPFFTTKAPDVGTGLGLAVVHRAMQRHGGRLVLHSTRGTGTRAELWFPLLVDGSVASPAPDTVRVPDSQHAGGAHLLLVDDEAAVRLATERALARLGHTVTTTADITGALAHIASGARVDLVVTDMMMPGGTGLDLLRAVRVTSRTIPFLIVTGYAVDDLDAIMAEDERVSVLAKPWTTASLALQVSRMLRRTGEAGALQDTVSTTIS